VEITLTPEGAGTLVRLRHFGLPSEALRRQHAEGWDFFLPRLGAAVEGRPLAAGVDPMT
jgi:hypothetical protein